MTEYWVSQGRHFCTFCKCWTADNKASIEFHEKGKRHIDSVNNKISELKKKGFEDAKAKQEMDVAMLQMEKGAFEAFKKDLQENPDLAIKHGFKPQVHGPSLPPPTQNTTTPTPPTDNAATATNIDWHEAKSPDGISYYWNIKTKATTWDKPNEFKSLEQQKLEKHQKKKSKTENSAISNQQKETESKAGSGAPDNQGATNMKVVHTSKAKFVMRTPKPLQVQSQSIPTITSQSEKSMARDQATGLPKWTPVEAPVPQPTVDLELPSVELPSGIPEFSVEPTEKKLKFEEKIVTSLGKRDVAFKKRKLGTGARNVRAALNTDGD